MTLGSSRRVKLSKHPQSGGAPELEIEVEIARDAPALTLMYVVRGDIASVSLPKEVAPARVDGLWQRTCFEAFVRVARSARYWEFNLSPSREWAAYRFNGYRDGMVAEPAMGDPHVEVRLEDSEFRISASVDVSGIPALALSEVWQVGLSSVIEYRNGGKSWWALAHPPGKADFHHADSFALHLPPGDLGS